MNDVTPSTLRALQNCDWLYAADLTKVFQALRAAGGEARVVGGAVRNTLLGLPVRDVDLATSLLPDEVMAATEAAGLKAVPTGFDHGTVTVIADGRAYEVTTLRADKDSDGRRAQVAYGKDWFVDAARRDFTMNALYVGQDGALFDPLGGYQDLMARRVRFIGDAQTRIREDYLRILRFFRFHADYGEGEPNADELWACVLERKGLERLSGERVWSELRRLLVAGRAVEILNVMFNYGLVMPIIGAVPLLSSFANLTRVESELGYSPDHVRRLAALCVQVKEDASLLGQRLKLSRDDVTRLQKCADNFRYFAGALSSDDMRSLLYKFGKAHYVDAALVAWSRDTTSVDSSEWRGIAMLPACWEIPSFPLSGHDARAVGLAEGPDIGRALLAVETWWVEAGFPEDLDALKMRLRLEAERLAAST